MRSRVKALAARLARAAGFEIRRVPAAVDAAPAVLFPPKFSTGDIVRGLATAREAHPGFEVWILVDGYVPPPAGISTVIDCRAASPEVLARVAAEAVFIYACDSDEIGLPWIRELVRQRRRFYPVPVYTPSTYANVSDEARRTLEAEFTAQSAAGFAKWDFGPGDFLNIVQAIDVTADLPGAYVEIGCYRGSSSCVAVRYMNARRLRRDCYFFDTFDGFAYDAARTSSDAMWQETHATEGEAVVRARIERHAAPERGLRFFVQRLNVIHDGLPAAADPIAVANVDVDLYEAVAAALARVAPRITPGGIMIVEDPGHTPALIGSRLALSEFLQTPAAAGFTALYMESGQTLLLRR